MGLIEFLIISWTRFPYLIAILVALIMLPIKVENKGSDFYLVYVSFSVLFIQTLASLVFTYWQINAFQNGHTRTEIGLYSGLFSLVTAVLTFSSIVLLIIAVMNLLRAQKDPH